VAGKKGRDSVQTGMQDQLDLCLLSALAERPEPVRLTRRPATSGKGGEGLKKREGDTWASTGVNFSERNSVVQLLNAAPFFDLPYSPTSILLS
jgi:hypothetical protein